MKIGVFDSGRGGLVILKALLESPLGRYDFAYFGDTANLPYGARSRRLIYRCALGCVDRLFRVDDCALVVVACNTASIAALRKIQREYLPDNFPDRRVLGVVIPTLETVSDRGFRRVGLIATASTIRSRVYEEELAKLNPDARLTALATPLIVPLAENGGDRYAPEVIADYMEFFRGADLEALVLGCTHYPLYGGLISRQIDRVTGRHVEIIGQDAVIPEKLADYLRRHPEIESRLGRGAARAFMVSDISDTYENAAARMFGGGIRLELACL